MTLKRSYYYLQFTIFIYIYNQSNGRDGEFGAVGGKSKSQIWEKSYQVVPLSGNLLEEVLKKMY